MISIYSYLHMHACRMSEALKEADEHIELPGNNGRYANIPAIRILSITDFYSKVKISEAIDDVCAYTHLTDGIFWYIKFSREPCLAKVICSMVHSEMFLLTCSIYIYCMSTKRFHIIYIYIYI